ncbi:hypothetical protein BT69DRAFT_1338375 [Atractiella rhizophila]|nr:hypothetical protein BT69DRAFT_1338375 [Atractiella rhizophila]
MPPRGSSRGRSSPRGTSTPDRTFRGRGNGRGGDRGNGSPRGNWSPRGRGGRGGGSFNANVNVNAGAGNNWTNGRGGGGGWSGRGGRGRGRGGGTNRDWKAVGFDYSAADLREREKVRSGLGGMGNAKEKEKEKEIEVDWNELGNVELGYSSEDPLLLLEPNPRPPTGYNVPPSRRRQIYTHNPYTAQSVFARAPPPPAEQVSVPEASASASAEETFQDVRPGRAGLGSSAAVAALKGGRGMGTTKFFVASNPKFRKAIGFVPATELTVNAMKKLETKKAEDVQAGMEVIFEEMEKRVEVASDGEESDGEDEDADIVEGDETMIEGTFALPPPSIQIVQQSIHPTARDLDVDAVEPVPAVSDSQSSSTPTSSLAQSSIDTPTHNPPQSPDISLVYKTHHLLARHVGDSPTVSELALSPRFPKEVARLRKWKGAESDSGGDSDVWDDGGRRRMGLGMEHTQDGHHPSRLGLQRIEYSSTSQSPDESISVAGEEELFFLDATGEKTVVEPLDQVSDNVATLEPVSATAFQGGADGSDDEDDNVVYVPPSLSRLPDSSSLPVPQTEAPPKITVTPPSTSPRVEAVAGPGGIIKIEEDITMFLDIPGSTSVTQASSKPPLIKSKKALKQQRRAEKKQKRREKKRERREENNFSKKGKRKQEGHGKRRKSFDLAPREDDSDLDWGSNGPPSGPSDDENDVSVVVRREESHSKVKKAKQSARDAALEDYLQNIGDGEDSTGGSANADRMVDVEPLKRIVETLGTNQQSMYDLEVEEQLGAAHEEQEDAEGWHTSSDSDSDSDGEAAIANDESMLVDVDEMPSDEEDPDVVMERKKAKGKQREVDLEYSVGEREVVEAFNAFDEFGALAEELEMMEKLEGGSKGKKKQNALLLNALREEISVRFKDDPFFGGGPKRKKQAPQFTSEDVFADELQAKWEADRHKKGEIKRKRAADRAADADASSRVQKKDKN